MVSRDDVRPPSVDIKEGEYEKCMEDLDALKQNLFDLFERELTYWVNKDGIKTRIISNELIKLSPDARSLLKETMTRFQYEADIAVKKHDEVMEAWWERAAEQVARVAAVIAASSLPDQEIVLTREEISNAIVIITWYGNELARVADSGRGTKEAQAAQRVLDAIVVKAKSGSRGTTKLKDNSVCFRMSAVRDIRPLTGNSDLTDRVLEIFEKYECAWMEEGASQGSVLRINSHLLEENCNHFND